MTSYDSQAILQSCSCTSPCSGSINCPGGCFCAQQSVKRVGEPERCVKCECICTGFGLAEIASKSESLDLRHDSTVRIQAKNVSMETLARFFSYHAPSLELYFPAKAIEEVINYQTLDLETLKDVVIKLGFRIVSDETLLSP